MVLDGFLELGDFVGGFVVGGEGEIGDCEGGGVGGLDFTIRGGGGLVVTSSSVCVGLWLK